MGRSAADGIIRQYTLHEQIAALILYGVLRVQIYVQIYGGMYRCMSRYRCVFAGERAPPLPIRLQVGGLAGFAAG